MLAVCIILYICGIIIIGISLFLFLGAILSSEMCVEGFFGLVLLAAFGGGILGIGISFGVEGNKQYDKITNIYSLKENEFTLGIGDGYYYYGENMSDSVFGINKVAVSKTTLFQMDNLEQPYLLNHKVKWEESVYSLYVPTDMKLIQYSVK